MYQKIKTSLQFTKNLFVTGAFKETSKTIEREICQHIPKGENKIIVEFGLGHGNITKEILRNISKSSKVYTFEVNRAFCKHVEREINDSRLVIINDSAENFGKYFDENVHSIISSLPFSFFSHKKKKKIIKDSYKALVKDGYYSQVLYSIFSFKKYMAFFDNCKLLRFSNFPIEYIYHCQKLNN